MGTQLLGLSDAEWRALTPRLLFVRLEQYNEAERVKNLRAGLIAAELRNTTRTKASDKVWTAFDFFPDKDARVVNEDTDVDGIISMFRKLRTG